MGLWPSVRTVAGLGVELGNSSSFSFPSTVGVLPAVVSASMVAILYEMWPFY